MALAAVVGGAVLLGVPKFWKTTPDAFPHGEVRVSAMDLAQAWSLKRSARRAEAAGQAEVALMAWRGALANNLASPESHRGVLSFLGRSPEARTDWTHFAIRSASWLLALTKTNLSDLTLVGSVMERYGRPRMALAMMAPIARDEDPDLEKARARCLLSSGRLDAFEELWMTRGEAWKDDPVLAMYHDAWLGATDDRTPGLEATRRLKDALRTEGEPGLTAARLLILVAATKGQADDLGQALEVLEARHSASVAQHGLRWRVLAASGRGDEARSLAAAYKEIPSDPEMAGAQWRAMRDIGMADEALVMAEENLGRYGSDLEAWRTYFDLLVEARRWKQTMRATANARLVASRQEPLFVEALFAEYRASLGENRKTDEARLAAELDGVRVSDLETLVRISSVLRTHERVDVSLGLLEAHEAAYRNWSAYWAEVFSAGLAGKDVEVLRHSVEELLRIEPNNPAWINNRAALLLITGEDPAEAQRLTLAGLARNPTSALLKINHAMALLANGRAAEAEGVLATVAASRLPKEGVANFKLAMAGAQLALGRPEQAAETAAAADRGLLLAPQVERLDRIAAEAARNSGK